MHYSYFTPHSAQCHTFWLYWNHSTLSTQKIANHFRHLENIDYYTPLKCTVSKITLHINYYVE